MRRQIRLLLALTAIGCISGLTGAIQFGLDVWRGQIPFQSMGYVAMMVVWFLMYMWQILLNGFGFVRVARTRGTDQSRPAVDWLVFWLLLYLLVSLSLSLAFRVARFTGLF